MWYVPHFIVLSSIVALYIVSIFIMKRKIRAWTGENDPNSKERIKKIKKELLYLLVYPLFDIALSILLFSVNVYEFTYRRQSHTGLWYITALLYPLEGAILALIFTLDAETRRRLTRAEIRAACFNFFFKSVEVSEYAIVDGVTDSIGGIQNDKVRGYQSIA